MAYERLVPGTVEWNLYMGNHKMRYEFARKILLKNHSKRVLDAATGVGYGAEILSQVVNEVIAVDKNEDALKIANEHFKKSNIHYLKDDCETLESVGGVFDAIVSFETLEHLKRPEAFIKRCFDLLGPQGVLVLSTPNQLVSGHHTKKDWAFHEKEYQPVELRDIIRSSSFTDVLLFGQYYSVTGILRNQFRSELNRIHSNPFMRLGKWMQNVLRGAKNRAILPELISDFEIRDLGETGATVNEPEQQPFVLIAIARK